MWTIEKVKTYVEDMLASQGYKLNFPVTINKRFTTSLGRVSYKVNEDGNVYPYKMEFNKELLEEGTDFDIESTIIHETCHVLAALKTGERQGHNAYFKALCASFGLENEKATCNPEYLKKKPKETDYKYTIKCACGMTKGYRRMCKTLKYIDFYRCSKCGGNLEMVQNF